MKDVYERKYANYKKVIAALDPVWKTMARGGLINGGHNRISEDAL